MKRLISSIRRCHFRGDKVIDCHTIPAPLGFDTWIKIDLHSHERFHGVVDPLLLGLGGEVAQKHTETLVLDA